MPRQKCLQVSSPRTIGIKCIEQNAAATAVASDSQTYHERRAFPRLPGPSRAFPNTPNRGGVRERLQRRLPCDGWMPEVKLVPGFFVLLLFFSPCRHHHFFCVFALMDTHNGLVAIRVCCWPDIPGLKPGRRFYILICIPPRNWGGMQTCSCTLLAGHGKKAQEH